MSIPVIAPTLSLSGIVDNTRSEAALMKVIIHTESEEEEEEEEE